MNKIILSILCATYLVTVSTEATAITWSEANIHFGSLLPTETVGGADVLTAELFNSGSDVVGEAPRDYSASSYSSSLTRSASFDLSSSISVPTSNVATILSAPLEARNRTMDTISIGAGGEFSDGDLVQILLQIQFDAIVQQEGRPSGGAQGDFEVRAGPGTVTLPKLVDYTTGGMNPPQGFEVHDFWEFIIDVTVGDVMTYQMDMRGTINGTAFDPGVSGTNLMNFDALIAASHAPGFDGLILTSEAGASTSPIPIPAAAWLFGSGLLGLVGVARRKKS